MMTEANNLQAFQESVLRASHTQPVVAAFYAVWCAPCKSLKPKLERVCRDKGVPLVGIDSGLAEAREVIMDQKVRSVPTVIVFVRGREVLRFAGDKTTDDIHIALAKCGAFQQPLPML